MQTIFEDEDKRRNHREADIMDIIIYTRRVSKYVKEKYIRRFRIRESKIQISGRVFVRIKEEI